MQIIFSYPLYFIYMLKYYSILFYSEFVDLETLRHLGFCVNETKLLFKQTLFTLHLSCLSRFNEFIINTHCLLVKRGKEATNNNVPRSD